MREEERDLGRGRRLEREKMKEKNFNLLLLLSLIFFSSSDSESLFFFPKKTRAAAAVSSKEQIGGFLSFSNPRGSRRRPRVVAAAAVQA